MKEVKIEKQEGVIAFLDALGTKGIWKNGDPSEFLVFWELIVGGFEKFLGSSKNGDIEFTVDAFSDTVIVSAIGSDYYVLLNEIGSKVNSLMSVAMLLGVNFRGCLSVGEFYKSPNIIVGPAVDEAAQYYMLPEWIGVSAAPSAHKILEDKIEGIVRRFGTSNIFMKYDIPLKTGVERNGWALNWPLLNEDIPNHMNKSSGSIYAKTLKDVIKKQLVDSTDIYVAFKLRNTLEFLDTAVIEMKMMDELFKKNSS